MAEESESRSTTSRQYVMLCMTCGRTEDRSEAEVSEFASAGWPRCCGAALSYMARPDAPRAAGDTAMERPALPGDTAMDKPALPPE